MKFTTKRTLYGMSSFHFTVSTNLKYLPLAVRFAQEAHPKIFREVSNYRIVLHNH